MSVQPQAPELGCEEEIVEVRCRGGLHFKVVGGDTIEIKCKHCSGPDSVVLHRYSLSDGTLQSIQVKEVRGRGARSHRKEKP